MNILAEKITKYFIDNGITTEEMGEITHFKRKVISKEIPHLIPK